MLASTLVGPDVCELSGDKPFDAVVGRFILQFLPDPVAALRSLSQLVHPGGVIAFHEPCWAGYSPACRALAALVCMCISGLRVSPALRREYRDGSHSLPHLPAGRAAYTKSADGNSACRRGLPALWIYDLVCTLLPQIRRLNLPFENLGNLDTLLERIQSEVAASKNPVPCVALIGAWSRTPPSSAS